MIRDDIKKTLLDEYVIEVVICLMALTFFVYQLFSKPESNLMQAVINNDLPAARKLINKSEALDELGPCRKSRCLFTTPLIEAARRGRKEMVAELLNAGANVNARDELGTTPLLAAITRGDADTATTLLNRRADPNLATCVGHGSCTTALRCARHLNHPELVAKIESYGGREDPYFLLPIECLWIDVKPAILLGLTRIVPVVIVVVLGGGFLRRWLSRLQPEKRNRPEAGRMRDYSPPK